MTAKLSQRPMRDAPPPRPVSAAQRCPDGTGHHWILPTPDGPMADGRCKKCGSEKAFPNAAPEFADFGETRTILRGLGRVEYS